MEIKSVEKDIYEWAEKSVITFNELSVKCNTKYYTQSPLCKIDDEVEWMIVGINPFGDVNNGVQKYTVDGFLEGNSTWENRFEDSGWFNYIGKARFFLGLNSFRRDDVIDNPKKTIWTNLTPFVSHKGLADVPKEVIPDSVRSLLELIAIVKPKHIVLFGVDSFKALKRYAAADIKDRIDFVKVIDNQNLHIGRIMDIPTVCVNHPSGKWAVSNKFVPIFIFLYFLTDRMENGMPVNTLAEVKKRMRDEFNKWLKQIEIKEV